MSSLTERSRALAEHPRRAVPTVHFIIGGVEYGTVVPLGVDRWSCVAGDIARLLGCQARAEEAPTYDRGTRSWTLPVTLSGHRWFGRTETVSVAVRWDEEPSGEDGPDRPRWRDLRGLPSP